MTATGGASQTPTDAGRSWTEILFTRKMLACIFLGFSSGMPLFVLVSLVPAWLRDNEVERQWRSGHANAAARGRRRPCEIRN